MKELIYGCGEKIVKLVLVESPGKVKNISQYLGSGYKVLATYGHVRSLPSKGGSVRPEENFALTWTMLSKADKAVSAIAKAVPKMDTLILATDLDREGEAISWHILEYLKEEGLLRKDLKIQRVSFNAITKKAILEALEHPRQVDQHLVEAYLARLSLDYLVGFTLSPVLWRKLPGSRSAGRVQSVALRLVVEREQEIKAFQIQEYWSVHGTFYEKSPFKAHVTHVEGKKLEKLSLDSEEKAKQLESLLLKADFFVENIIAKRIQRHPPAPFITSNLLQEASRKLGYSPARTMVLAQKLYEGVDFEGETVGLITYMRTDSPMIVPEAIKDLRSLIETKWGPSYVAETVRKYKVKAHSQEAHEAIRPTNFTISPEKLKTTLEEDLWKLYKLIWDRTLASQMASAQYDQTTVIIESKTPHVTLKATGSVLVFDGFLVLYDESKDEEEDSESAKKLPLLTKGCDLDFISSQCDQHFTQPPARYTEASLVKTLEELGIGRPSTYPRILMVLQERDYVGIEKKRLYPKELGLVVTAFLRKFFAKYVDYHFTAELEGKLDEVSEGKQAWKDVLGDFWPPFYETIQQSHTLKVADVLEQIKPDVVSETIKPCPKCSTGSLMLKLGRTGPFMACSGYPECTYSADLSGETGHSGPSESRVLGPHPDTQEDVLLKKGPYGWYVQHGVTRTSLGDLFSPDSLALEQALWLLSLPKNMGKHPDTQEDIIQGIGKFGPYIKYQNRFYSLKTKEPQQFSLEEAISLIARAPEPKPKAQKLKEEPQKKAVQKKAPAKKTTKKKETEQTLSAEQ